MPHPQTRLQTSALSRRHLLGAALALPWLAACGDQTTTSRSSSGRGGRDTALLFPLTGEASGVGQNMARAASLVTAAAPDSAPPVYDTTDTPEGAAAAATMAIAKGAKLLIGPLKSDQTPAVLAVAGTIPVITFSNDEALAAQGAYVMGITPAQSVATMFSYARAQGLDRIAVLMRDGPLGAATALAARQIAGAGGITLTTVLARDPGQPGLIDALKQAGGGALPQAVYLPDGGDTLAGFARGLNGADLRLLGSVQWGAGAIAGDRNLAGAWFAAPPPDLFAPFAESFQARFGVAPGVVAGLGHDAALLATGLGNGPGTSRKHIERAAGFTGVLGAFRFLKGGRCQRDLSVLSLDGGAISVLAEVSGT